MKRSKIGDVLQLGICIIALGLTRQLLTSTHTGSGLRHIVEADGSDSGVSVTFEAFPDGTLIVEDTVLVGDEFSSEGVLFAGSPIDEYCEDATAAAIMTPPHSTGSIPEINFLSPSTPDEIGCISIPIEITFIEPVQDVRLFFNGASVVYAMYVYDETGNLLSEEIQEAECCSETFEIAYHSSENNVKSVVFGHTTAATYIKEIFYARDDAGLSYTIILPFIVRG